MEPDSLSSICLPSPHTKKWKEKKGKESCLSFKLKLQL